jgi:hypothetical protein
MTIGELLSEEKIERKQVENIADESAYWEKASDFILENWSRNLSTLSPKQATWASRIIEDLAEKRIEGKL